MMMMTMMMMMMMSGMGWKKRRTRKWGADAEGRRVGRRIEGALITLLVLFKPSSNLSATSRDRPRLRDPGTDVEHSSVTKLQAASNRHVL